MPRSSRGTIAAAAVINEVIAVITAKKGFEWAGELNASGESPAPATEHTIITISRQHGSGGREIAQKVAKQLGIPFYDREIIELAAKSSDIDIRFFENSETKDTGNLLYRLSNDVHLTQPITDKIFLQQVQVIRVFVCADASTRETRVRTVYREPAEDLDKLEKNRRSYYQHYTGRNFGDAENYDLCLNSGSLGMEECVKTICSAYHDQANR